MRPKSDLRSYQDRMIDHLYDNEGTIIVARMGAGKTATTLTAIQEELQEGVIKHALIIAPKRVAKYVWPDEIRAWAHLKGLRYAVLNDYPPAKRMAALQQLERRDLTIVGVDLVQWLADAIDKLEPSSSIYDLLVLDEISRFRSPKSKRAKALARRVHKFNSVWGLTGTVAPNGLHDLFGPARLVTKGALWGKSFYAWRERNFYPADRNGYVWRPKYECKAGIIQDFRTIAMVLEDKDMPELPDLVTIEHRIDLPADIRAKYRQMQNTLVASIDGTDIVAVNAAVASGKLAQMASGFLYDTADDDVRYVTRLHTEKLDWLEDLVTDMNGRPLLIIYEFQNDLNDINARFGKLPLIGPGVSDKQTRETIDAWNARKLPLLVMHAASGGHGLNLQAGGSDIAWMNLTWSPELYEQTIARLHRPGQTEKVIVNVCIANGTVDEAKQARVLGKMSAQAAFQRFLDKI